MYFGMIYACSQRIHVRTVPRCKVMGRWRCSALCYTPHCRCAGHVCRLQVAEQCVLSNLRQPVDMPSCQRLSSASAYSPSMQQLQCSTASQQLMRLWVRMRSCHQHGEAICCNMCMLGGCVMVHAAAPQSNGPHPVSTRIKHIHVHNALACASAGDGRDMDGPLQPCCDNA